MLTARAYIKTIEDGQVSTLSRTVLIGLVKLTEIVGSVFVCEKSPVAYMTDDAIPLNEQVHGVGRSFCIGINMQVCM